MKSTTSALKTRRTLTFALVCLIFWTLCFVFLPTSAGTAAAGDSPAITFTIDIVGPFKYIRWKSAEPAGANTRICFSLGPRPLFCEDVEKGATSGTARSAVGMPIEDCTAEFVSND